MGDSQQTRVNPKRSARSLTTSEIMDYMSDNEEEATAGFEEDIDDSDLDAHYEPTKNNESESDMDVESGSDCSGPPVPDQPGDKPEQEIRVFMVPPAEKGGDATDTDSDDIDNPSGVPKHIPRRLMRAGGKINKRIVSKVRMNNKNRLESIDAESSDDEAGRSKSVPVRSWSKVNSGKVGSNIPEYVKPILDPERQSILEDLSSAYDYYKLFQPTSFAEEIVYQSHLYAVSKSIPRQKEITLSNYRCTEATLLLSGYNSPPRRKMMWEEKPDCINTLVASNVRRDTVDTILKSLHFRDNARIKDSAPDSYFKVRPIFENLNRGGHWMRDTSDSGLFSVDECMIPYFGRHSSKQYIRGKPIRYGYKTWSLCTSEGAYVYFEPYCGSDTNIQDFKTLGGQGPNVVCDLVYKSKLIKGSQVYMDNLFTSAPLLDKLSELGVGGTGTVRQNRLNKVPIITKKVLESKKYERGHHECVYSEDQVLVAWKDSKAVYVESNTTDVEPMGTCSRYNRAERKQVSLPVPACVTDYNKGMGGVDLLDNLVSCYRINWRIRKWWWPFYAWSLSVSAVNAWRLRNIQRKHQEPYLDFLRELVNEMLIEHGQTKSKAAPVMAIGDGLRTDGLNHWPVDTDVDVSTNKKKTPNCVLCYRPPKKLSSKTSYKCSKCGVALHIKCFKDIIFLTILNKFKSLLFALSLLIYISNYINNL